MVDFDFDLVVRDGTVVTSFDCFSADIGVKDGVITAIGRNLRRGREELSAEHQLVIPGGLDPHCHIEEVAESGSVQEETFETGSKAALAGGTTSLICFKPQWRGHSIKSSAPDYLERASRALADYSFHQIITDPSPEVLDQEIPTLLALGVRSLKVFLTYDPLRLSDGQFISVLSKAKQLGMMVTVHCENYDAIEWLQNALLAAGKTAPVYHAWARPVVVEREAAHRAISLAELVGQPIQVFHVSAGAVADEIERARKRGSKVWGETCMHYLTHTIADLEKPHFEGAKVVCSPALRDEGEADRLWAAISRGTLNVISSDHCGFSFAKAKRDPGSSAYGQGTALLNDDGTPAFNSIPNGVPGIETRMTVLFNEAVTKGRLDLPAFVRLTSTNAAHLFGLKGRKGDIIPGADADLVIWDPTREKTINVSDMHQAIDYTPWEGYSAKGWPTTTIRRGEVVVRDNQILAKAGTGKLLPRA
ncbi:dihydropyrimidinase [Mesorhizobium hawassense]|uniref:Dihydropyrimidinase n=1 Tax=Mesorhizobium hawassense TaxID=1209954 RepID=A0A330HYH5_9HYPH|nr:dihydropyrimidinase [Mesorhizobium hawassense]RAZ91749.1 dihydropyrimidinase [Mesorhizobium hawassense]